MRALRIVAGMLAAVLGIIGVFNHIQTTAPPGGSEGAAIVTSARAPDNLITAAAMVALITTALFLTALVMQALHNQRSTLKSRTRSAIHLFTKADLDRSSSKLAFSPFKRGVSIGHRQPHTFLNRVRGLGSHAHKATVPFPCAAA